MLKRNSILLYLVFAAFFMHASLQAQHKSYSGIYPHLAMYNNEGEAGTGAVVPWKNKLYVVTYGPHLPLGSSDKLYIISNKKEVTIYDQSVGGTPANRMIHRESDQMFIGPYIVDAKENISVISPLEMPGRLTGMARHLFYPEDKVYYATMEEGFYEYDLHTKKITELYTDVNLKSKTYFSKLPEAKKQEKQKFADLLGVHGKGVYSGQGVLVYSNNGEPGGDQEKYDIPSGSLSEWDGKDWKLVRRNQFVEVTGPGGIYGNLEPEDPIWTTGWDHKSLLLGVRNHNKGWRFYRLPKASRSYDGAHGWNTEWPRIRDIKDRSGDYLMTMHGMFWRFPKTFNVTNTKGIRPRSAYLKIIGDFARWNNQIVFGCDDSAQKEFLNKRKIKGNLQGAGQSHSNLWFVEDQHLDRLGSVSAEGAVWINEEVKDNLISEPFLFSGWEGRNIWLKNHNNFPMEFEIQVDAQGNDEWAVYKKISVQPSSSLYESVAADIDAEWVRVKVPKAGIYSVLFSFHAERQATDDPALFSYIATGKDPGYLGGYLYSLGDNQRKLGVLAGRIDHGHFKTTDYYELDGDMKLKKSDHVENRHKIEENFQIPKDLVTIDENSVLVVDDKGRRWRFPKGDAKFDKLTFSGLTRLAREVVTERDLLNLHGTFYELPAENADGFAKVRPIASHNFAIHDFASYRGLLILSGINPSGRQEHIIRSEDGKAAVWVGTIDDLWKLGKLTGKGGPWSDTAVQADLPSDPYLFGFYQKRSLTMSHDSDETIQFTLQLDPSGNGEWVDYKQFDVSPTQKLRYTFPEHMEARWIRFVANRSCRATTDLIYD